MTLRSEGSIMADDRSLFTIKPAKKEEEKTDLQENESNAVEVQKE